VIGFAGESTGARRQTIIKEIINPSITVKSSPEEVRKGDVIKAVFPNKGAMTAPSIVHLNGVLLWAPPEKRRKNADVKVATRVVQKQPRSNAITKMLM